MIRARFVTRNGVEETSDTEFFSRIFGHAPRTPAEREAEWRAEIEKFADMIERGNEWAVPCPCLAAASKLVAERAEQQLTSCVGDPLLKRRVA